MTNRKSLIEVLQLETLEQNLFRGVSADAGFDPVRIFGGQVVAQALLAAYRTIERRVCHSLHCYFIRPGDQRLPVIYEVERAREGKSFSTRRVIAIQNGVQIFNLSASFQQVEDGVDHQAEMPGVPPPQDSASVEAANLEFRAVTEHDWSAPEVKPPRQQIWFRAHGDFQADVALNQAVLAYVSDFSLLATSLLPHALSWKSSPLQMASLDHALWFHRPTDMNEWHLYDQDSPSASGARGFSRGLIYRHDGVLVASTCQEGLIRVRP